ncbi:MAG: UDP-N-acetylmuramate dehydrogenase [Clostridium sp.]
MAYSGVLREDEKAGKTLIRAGAGELLSRTARLAMECSLTGMEFASGIPGTIGGALVMNAGAYGSEICNVLSRAKVMTTEGEILELPAEELELGYRTSCIPKKNYIVLEAVFELNKGSKEAISSQMRELAGKRREKQPLEYPSAGSTFKRPEGYFAAKLIEDAGLKGFSVGGAMVSEKHSGFVINYNDATASDVMELCRQVREKVKALSGVELEMEVKRLGEFK